MIISERIVKAYAEEIKEFLTSTPSFLTEPDSYKEILEVCVTLYNNWVKTYEDTPCDEGEESMKDLLAQLFRDAAVQAVNPHFKTERQAMLEDLDKIINYGRD